MFAKLKKKIQDEGGGLPTLPNLSEPVASVHGPGLASPTYPGATSPSLVQKCQPADSSDAISSSEAGEMKNTSTKEELMRKLLKSNEMMRKLETKISELAAMVKDRQKTIDYLDSQLKQSQTESSEKLQTAKQQCAVELNENKRKYEESTKELKIRLRQLEEELRTVNMRNEDAAREKQTEEQIQQEVIRLKTELSVSQFKTTEAVVRSQQLAEEVSNLMDQITQATQYSEKLVTENRELQHRVEELGEMHRVQEQCQRELNKVQAALADLENDHECLKHTSEVYQQKMSRLVEEKDDLISHLKDQTEMLEKRAHTGALTENERIKALETERLDLDRKLAESREQLNQIKTSWSDKIAHLESQITHLNEKLVEDGEDARKQIEQAHRHKDELQQQVNELRKAVADSSEKCHDFERQLKSKQEHCEHELLQVKLQHSDIETQLRGKVNDLQQEITANQKARDLEKLANQKKLSDLQSRQSEWLEKEIELERQNTEMNEAVQLAQQQIDRLTADQGKHVKTLEENKQELLKQKTALTTATEQAKKMNAERDELHQQHTSACEDRDELMLRNAQLRQDLDSERRNSKRHCEDLEMELQQRNHSVAGLEQVLQEMQMEIAQYKNKVDEMEKHQMITISEIESQEVSRLQRHIQAQEDQIIERNKTIKKLQQRVADFKKTLQRELNVHTDLQDDGSPYHSDSQMDNPTVASIPVTSSSTVNVRKQAINGLGRPLDIRQELERDDVNLRYLRHVVLKFLLSRESEAIHLIKALSMLLRLNTDEEQLLHQTLEYKMSWFGTRPQLGEGQHAKIIPPSY